MHYIGQSLLTLNHRGTKLKWNPSTSSDVLGYYVYMSEQDDKHFNRMVARPLLDSEWTSPPLRSDVPYYFYVTSVDTSGNESAPSAVIPFSFSDTVDDGRVEIKTRTNVSIKTTETYSEPVTTKNLMTSFQLGGNV